MAIASSFDPEQPLESAVTVSLTRPLPGEAQRTVMRPVPAPLSMLPPETSQTSFSPIGDPAV